MVFLDPVERYKYEKVRDSVAISIYAKNVEKELEDSNGYKLKVYLTKVSPKMALDTIDNKGNPRYPVIAIAPVTKKAKIYRRFVIILTTLIKKATTTMCNYLLTIKNYSLQCIILQWVRFHLISQLRVTANCYSARQDNSAILPVS